MPGRSAAQLASGVFPRTVRRDPGARNRSKELRLTRGRRGSCALPCVRPQLPLPAAGGVRARRTAALLRRSRTTWAGTRHVGSSGRCDGGRGRASTRHASVNGIVCPRSIERLRARGRGRRVTRLWLPSCAGQLSCRRGSGGQPPVDDLTAARRATDLHAPSMHDAAHALAAPRLRSEGPNGARGA